ncbi:uncharacterized protein N7473_000252 [Penicillium subrubescens]|uniref:Interferon alpha-inducible protein 27, mitochondrial n=1 Tax=Penicillium subrubescens TaxID=1316194 RepID=A0A1Q5SNS1_9EURO|nr:uncharacterized protein N7473_000252 [Penicillium subrubescens]KAJ5910949.1 hypothetical protein N7473_000252 [Penicillium subrubescens]OKO89648.1 hypothetical protein PENSUB_13714 [Penicillium subrubescens]
MLMTYGKTALAVSANLTPASWGAHNPLLATCAVVCSTGVVIIAAPGLTIVPVLPGMRFTAGGIKAGSAAAAAHSSIGNIAAGSAMAVGQSAGAGGAGIAIVNGVAQLGGAAMGLGSPGLAWLKRKPI